MCYVRTILLLSENGQPIYFENPQGGEFTPSVDRLYAVTGYLDDTEEEQISEGIHVFDATSWRRIGHSTNGHGLFNFAYDPDGLIDEEPQGLTFWDLDQGQAPGLSGQLHVLLLDNDPDSDDIYLKHYTHRIWVDHAASSPGNGTIESPFPTVGQAAAFAWSGSEIRLRTGAYPEALTIPLSIRLTAVGGPALIGAP